MMGTDPPFVTRSFADPDLDPLFLTRSRSDRRSMIAILPITVCNVVYHILYQIVTICYI